MAGEISIEEMFGQQKPSSSAAPPSAGGAVSVEDMFSSKPGAPPSAKKTLTLNSGSDVVKAVEGMSEDSFLNRSLKALWSAQLYAATNPEKAMSGAAKAVAGGAVSLGETAIQGISGLASMMTGKGFGSGKEAAQNFTNNVRDVSALISGVNLSPEGKEEEAMGKLLAILPDGITAAGDNVFEKTGSALAGAGTQGLLTLLTLKPNVASRSIRFKAKTDTGVPPKPGAKPSSPLAPKVEATFDELAMKQPEQALEIAKHVGEADPKLQAFLEAKVEKFKNASEAELKLAGEAQARAKIQEQAGGNEQLGLNLEREETQLGFPITREAEQLGLGLKGGEARKADLTSQRAMDLPAQPQQLKLLKDDKAVTHSADEIGEHRIESEHGELLAQESSGRLQVKRIDVKEGAKGTGEGMAMMLRALREAEKLKVPLSSDVVVSPEAARLYAGLKKRGFEVVQNPFEKSSTTGNLVSKDPRKGVFEVRLKREPAQTEMEGLYKPPGGQGELKLQRPLDEQIPLGTERVQTKRTLSEQKALDLAGQAPRQMPLLPYDKVSAGIFDTVREVYAELEQVGVENRIAPEPGKSGTETLRRDLPPVPKDRTRIFIVNKPGERGQAIMTARDAETLGVPLASTYRGKTAYVDVLTQDLPKLRDRNGKIFQLPGQIASKARPVAQPRSASTYQHKVDPVLFTDNGKPVLKSSVQGAFTIGLEALRKAPGVQIVEGKLREYYDQVIRTVNPEGLGPEAKVSAAVLAKNIAEQMQKDASYLHRSEPRRAFWNHRADEAAGFIRGFETGEKFSDPMLNKAAEGYRNWNKEIAAKEERLGFEYEAVDNYLYHLFEDSPGVADFFQQRFGPKWNNPKFIKDRSFNLYEEAIEAGYKPKFTNPEDIMLARQHASDVAEMRIQSLKDLETYGMAKKITEKDKARPEDFPSTEWRSPNGEKYWVHNNASAVLHNAFNTKSLWNMRGIGGDAFRGAMALKNTIVPIKLAFSLFHPLHVLTIDNATGMVRASKELLSGTMSPAKWIAEMGKASIYKGVIDNPRSGSRVLRAYQGKAKDADITAVDRQALQYMAEGGMIPEMSSQYKTNAISNFKNAVQKRSATALWHAPLAAINLLQKPMFEIWIPSLKIASYLKDVQTALRTAPELIEKPMERQLAFRRIAKSIDNRYGEMAYNTLFWNRWVKDLAVANTLSLGWQMGFIREYGGGMLDLGQFAKGGQLQKVKTGMLDRPLFVTFYTAQALAYGGLMTWALTGKSPETLLDYVYPKNGEKNKDESDQRVSTMFYPREFMSIYKHMEHQGVVSGLGHLASSKASGVVGMVSEWASGVNSFGQEISDPDAPAYEQLAQKLAYTMSDLTPISIGAIREQASENPLKTGVMNVAGFSPAPKYISESGTQSEIKRLYLKYYAPKQTPYEKARYSEDARKLRTLYDSNKIEEYSDLLDKVRDKYDLNAKDEMRLQQNLMRGDDPTLSMFKRLTWQQQKKVLDSMSEDERGTYLPLANKEHIRYGYEPPEEK